MHPQEKYFDEIAMGYDRMDTGSTAVRKYCEAPTALKLASPLHGKSVLEVACSDGFFSRLLKQAGALRMTGVDLSPKMIALAQARERKEPLGIVYHVADILRESTLTEDFDLVFSSFVLSYARDRDELLSMCRALRKRLKPGGRLISMNDNPDLLEDSVTGFSKYGKTKRVFPSLKDGATITVSWEEIDEHGSTESFSFDCEYFTRDTLVRSLQEAGFSDVKVHQPEVSKEGLDLLGREYWQLFLNNPLLVFITAGT